MTVELRHTYEPLVRLKTIMLTLFYAFAALACTAAVVTTVIFYRNRIGVGTGIGLVVLGIMGIASTAGTVIYTRSMIMPCYERVMYNRELRFIARLQRERDSSRTSGEKRDIEKTQT